MHVLVSSTAPNSHSALAFSIASSRLAHETLYVLFQGRKYQEATQTALATIVEPVKMTIALYFDAP
jgi:hypothetical protein